LDRALGSLEFMISVDPFLNETTRHADVILPPPSILARDHYDFAFYGLAVRNVANFSPRIVDPEGPDEWEILSRIALAVSGQSASGDPEIVAQMALAYLVQKATAPSGSLAGREESEIFQALDGRGPVEKILDFRLRAGPYGDRFGERPDGLSLAKLEEEPHGIDLGPLQPRLPNALRTLSGKVELVPALVAADLERLESALGDPVPDMLLIGRRQLRSNNSWMHNVPTMLRGSNRCTMLVNPVDAERLNLSHGTMASVRSRVGEIEVPVEVCDEMMPGVVSIPHGWGHGLSGTRLSVAATAPGVSMNDVTDEQAIDPLSGNAVLNAVPIEISPAVAELEGLSPASRV
jgi:anaerobic selenocysteine-containing dehydrogenase